MTSGYFGLPHVEANRLQSLRLRIARMSRISVEIIVLLISSVAIATLGLFLNSPAVIIGAMIIAPLMRPLMGLSLGILTADTVMLWRAAVCLIVGTGLGCIVSYCMALILQVINLTPEMVSRTNPNLLDLCVAFVAGAVGAYCQTNEDLADSLAGVAISVALVPPLSVAGIGLATANFEVWWGASLLYLTNLVGIAVAGSLVFLVMGYTPLKQARKGLLISGGIVAMLLIPLTFSMREMIIQNQLSRNIKEILQERTITFRNVQLQSLEVNRFKRPVKVVATVLALEEHVTPKQVQLVQQLLEHETGMNIDFVLRVIPSKEVSAYDVGGGDVSFQPMPVFLIESGSSGIVPDGTVPEGASTNNPIHTLQQESKNGIDTSKEIGKQQGEQSNETKSIAPEFRKTQSDRQEKEDIDSKQESNQSSK